MVRAPQKDLFVRPSSKGRLPEGMSQDLCLGLGPPGPVVLRNLYRLPLYWELAVPQPPSRRSLLGLHMYAAFSPRLPALGSLSSMSLF